MRSGWLHRFLFISLLSFFIGGVWVPSAPSQISEEEQRKRELFLRAREDVRPVPAQPATPPATPARRPATTATPSPPRQVPSSRPAATPRAQATPRPAATPPPRRAATPRPTPAPRATPAPRPRATPAPRATRPAAPPAEVVVEKSGRQADQGLQPAPSRVRPPARRWQYLTPSIRSQIDAAKVRRGRWKYIIIHNSATRQGNAQIFDNYHRRVRKMQHGLAYHFVIGNGTSSGNGQIEIGNRWRQQLNGGHVASDYLNNIAIGICLVGDFDRDQPSKAQLDALEELVGYLRARVGKVQGKNAIVRGHKEINPRPTSCPGRRFPLSWLRQKFGS